LNKKYLFIAKKFKKIKRGSWTTSKDLKEEFPNYIELKENTKIKNLKNEVLDYEKVVLITQVPHLYNMGINIISLKDIKHTIFIRNEYNVPLYNSCTNGFYYYKNHKNIKNYIPFIPNIKTTHEPKNELIGFYYRPWLNTDSCVWFLDSYKNNDIPIMTMGDIPRKFIKRKNWQHTTDREEFFSKITYYIYPKSTLYIDPFPTSICEAIQAGKKIHLPNIGGRRWKDGIDDIEDCIKYDRNILNFNVWKNWYNKILNNNFNNIMDRRKYNNMVDWILKEVI